MIENKNKLEEAMENLEREIPLVFDSAKYKNYLDTMSKFHSYSINNSLLIYLQKPDATQVAGYTTWQKMNRQVQKGETGITIIAPCKYKKKQEVVVTDNNGNTLYDANGEAKKEEREVEVQGYKATTVFDYSQTDGEPLPSLVSDLTNPVDGYDDYLDAIKDISPVPIRFDNINGTAKGYFSPKVQEIVLRRGMSEEQTIKTALHEVAHARLGHGSKDDTDNRRTHEVQAESVAYCCCKALGLNTEDYSFGYIAGWSSGKDIKELKESLEKIRLQADQMISGIELKMKQIMELRAEKIKEPKMHSNKMHIAM